MDKSEVEAYVDACARALGLAIAPEERPGVIENFARLAQVAAVLDGFALAPDDEPGPVWRP